MNKFMKIIIGILLLAMILFIPNMALGASSSISASNKTIEKGKSTNIYVSINSTEAWNLKITASGGILSGTTESTDVSDGETSKQVISASFVANSVGTYVVNLSGQITGSDLIKKNVNESVPITVTESAAATTKDDPAVVGSTSAKTPSTTSNRPSSQTETKKSSDNKLKELIIAEGTISPEFGEDVREYTLTVPNEVTSLNITATPNNSKAKTEIKNNSELQVGENQVIITVIAEDGTTSNYIINVTREKPLLVLNTLKITYIDENGNTQELLLNPQFDSNVLEYNLDQISYLIKTLNIEAIANLEGATIEIVGNENLVEGENTITITLTIKAEEALEGEEQAEDETITYTIKFSKEATPIPPTLMGRISNWFNGMKNSIKTWYNDNYYNIVIISLYSSLLLLGGVIIYMSIDYDKYKMIIQKVQKVSQINQAELSSEIEIPKNIVKETMDTEIDNTKENVEIKKAGRHF